MKNDPYIVAAFLKSKNADNWSADGTHPLVTISRQHGTGGDLIAMRTSQILTEMNHGKQPWLVVDKEIAERVLREHHLPKEITRFLSEEERDSIQNEVEALWGISLPVETMVDKMTRTIIHIAKMGHVVFLGHATQVIAAKYPRALHVRIIGSLENRVKRVMERKKCSRDVALTEVKDTDHTRHHFVETHFHINVDNPLLYDMTLNVDRISQEEAAHTIARLVSSPDFREKQARDLTELRHTVLGT